MERNVVFFGALLFAALIAGGQYLVWWDYHPAGMTPAFYTEHMQHAIRVIGLPLFSVQITTAVLTSLLVILFRKQRPAFYLLAAAALCCIAGVLMTTFGNIPILNQIETWNAGSPPADWRELALKWWWIHTVRFGVQLTALGLLIYVALFYRREGPGPRNAP